MLRKTRFSTALFCVALTLVGLSFWKDYSRRTLEQALDAPTDDAATLIQALESSDEVFRRKAARVVAQMGAEAKDALPALIEALSTEDTSYTYSTHTPIVLAIGSIGADAEPAVPYLVKLLDQQGAPGSTVFRNDAAVKALGQIGPAAASALPTLLSRLEGQIYVKRDATIQAVALIGPARKMACNRVRSAPLRSTRLGKETPFVDTGCGY